MDYAVVSHRVEHLEPNHVSIFHVMYEHESSVMNFLNAQIIAEIVV